MEEKITALEEQLKVHNLLLLELLYPIHWSQFIKDSKKGIDVDFIDGIFKT